MTDFRVGDRVRVIKDTVQGWMPVGTTGVVFGVGGSYGVNIDMDEPSTSTFYDGAFRPDELELVTPDTLDQIADIIRALPSSPDSYTDKESLDAWHLDRSCALVDIQFILEQAGRL